MNMRLIALMMLIAPAAFGGKLIFDGRFDGQSQAFNDDASTAGLGHNNFRYLIKTARLDYQGNLNDKTSVRARALLNTNPSTTAQFKRDSMNSSVDYFFINHQLTDDLALTAGKYGSDMGGWENQIASPDMYLFSATYNGGSTDLNSATKAIFLSKTGNTINSFSWSGTGMTRYYTGAKLAYGFNGQEIALHSANLLSDDTTGIEVTPGFQPEGV